MEAWSHHMLALTLLGRNRIGEAKASATAALRHFREAGDVAGITLVLDDLAGVAVADGNLPRAGRMWGAARQLQKTTGADLASFNETGFGTLAIPNPRHVLSPEDLERYGAEGAAMGLDEAVAYAFDTFAPASGDEPAALP
jgi:hypothetical protein